MDKYQVDFAPSFEKDLKKLDRPIQRQIMRWIGRHLVDVDFPTSPGKTLHGNLRDYVRFRVGDYRIISTVDDKKLTITHLNVSHRKKIYK